MDKKAITMQDIAKLSGYSKTSVSFAFNNPEKIGKKATEEILAVAKKYDYSPNPLARNFSLGRLNTIGFLLPQEINESIANPYIIDVIRGLGSVCQDNNNSLTIIPPVNKSLKDAVLNAAVYAIVTMGYSIDSEIEEALRRRKIPTIMIDGHQEHSIPSININDTQTAYNQMKYALERNHKKIAVVSLTEPSFVQGTGTIVEKRLAGYKKALAEYSDVETEFYSCNTIKEEAGQKCREIFSSSFRPTCIVSMADIVAIGMIQELDKMNINVPEDVSVIGFDNIIEGEYIKPSLTTVSQPGYKKGVAAAEYIFSRINQVEAKELFNIETSIIERESFKGL